VFSTNAPSTNLARGKLLITADDYPALADGQIFMGPGFRLKTFPGKRPLYVASYAQLADEYLDDYGWMGVESMAILDDYFGELPFEHYSLMLSKALQPGNRQAPAFAMEHRNSSTFFGDPSGAQTVAMTPAARQNRITTYLHHMAHAYIPLRAYAGQYRPRPLEIPPLIETIWMNEGFAWFLVYDTLKQPRLAELFRSSVYDTAPEIKALSLFELSYLASTLYATDFRTGRAIFSRGALMAMEMNTFIRASTGGKKGMRDVLRYMYQYAKTHPLPIPATQLPVLMSQGCGLDLGAIYRKWLGRIE
jgi:predicted metalloprotease with PDZ domain